MNEVYHETPSISVGRGMATVYFSGLDIDLGVEAFSDGSVVISVQDDSGGILQASPMATRSPSEFSMSFRRRGR